MDTRARAERHALTAQPYAAPFAVTDSLIGLVGKTWQDDNTLIVDGPGAAPLVRLAARAGAKTEFIAPLDSASLEIDQVYPSVLPNGRVFTHLPTNSSRRSSVPVVPPIKKVNSMGSPGRSIRKERRTGCLNGWNNKCFSPR